MKTLKAVLSLLLLCFTACGGDSSPFSNQAPSIPTPRTAEQIRETYRQLFEPPGTLEDLISAQRTFLQQNTIVESTATMTRYEWGVTFAGGRPCVPMIGQYEPAGRGGVLPNGPIQNRKFPREFHINIPDPIKVSISQYDIHHVDLFLVVQAGMPFLANTHSVQLVTHLWAKPDLELPYVGTVFRRNLLMGIFEPDQDIFREVPIGRVAPFEVHLHDNALSPNTARVNIRLDMLDLSFWSVVIDPPTQRAAVTLHILVQQNHFVRENPDGYPIGYFFNNRSPGNETLQSMMDRLHTEGATFFAGTPLMQKLEALTRVTEQ